MASREGRGEEVLQTYLSVLQPEFSVWPSCLEPVAVLASSEAKARMAALAELGDGEVAEAFVSTVRPGLAALTRCVQEQQWDRQAPVAALFAVYALGLKATNMKAIVRQGLLLSVYELFEAATKLAATLSSMTPELRAATLPGEGMLSSWLQYLALLSGLCLRVFNSIMFPMFGWHRSWWEQSSDLWAAPEEDMECVARAAAFGGPARAALAGDMALLGRLRDWFAVLDAFEPMCGSLVTMRVLAVETVAVLSHGSPPPQLVVALRQHGLIELTVQCLGMPRAEPSVPGDAKSPAADCSSAQYALQLVGLRACATLSEAAPENVAVLAQLDFVPRALDVLLWAAEVEEIKRRKDSGPGPLSRDSRGPPLELFVEIAEAKSLIGAYSIVPLPAEPPARLLNQRMRLLFGAFRAFVLGCPKVTAGKSSEMRVGTISSLFDLFNLDAPKQSAHQVRARATVCMAGVHLQAHVLTFLVETLRSYPGTIASHVIQTMRARGMWEIFFSECFFRRNPSQDMVLLQDTIWELLEHLGTVDPRNNTAEVKCCLAVLSRYPVRASAALSSLFVKNATATGLYDGKKLLSGVVEAVAAFRDKPEAEREFAALLRVLAFCFCLLQVREASETDVACAELLLRLLESPSSRYLALDCMLSTLETGGERVPKLFQSYCNLLSEEKEVAFARALLAGVRRTVKKSVACKKMWRKSCVFAQTLEPMLANSSSTEHELCADVLSTMILLQNRSRPARSQFAKMTRFDLLLVPFLTKSASDVIIREPLFSMLMDGEEKAGYIRNPAVLSVLFGLWDLLDKNAVLDTLIGLVSAHHANLGVCCAHGVTKKVLLLVPSLRQLPAETGEKLLQLLEMLLCQSLPPAELKAVFRLLQSTGDRVRPLWWTRLVTIFRKTVQSPHYGPRFYFCLDGAPAVAAISLPPMTWPRSGFSVSLWLLIEENPAAVSTVFSFGNGAEEGVELVCDKRGVLQYTTLSTNESRSIGKIDLGVWCHVVVSHQNSGLLIGRSEVRVIISGVAGAGVVLPYPQCPQATKMVFGQGLCGRMGALYVFSTPLSLQQSCKVFSLGPSYSSVFFVDPLLDTSAAVDLDLMQALGASVLMSFNSVSRDGKRLLDSKMGVNAVASDGVTSCSSFAVDKSLSCIGGIACIVPLLTQLLHHHGEKDAKTTTGKSDALLILSLLMELLKESERNQRDFAHCRGMAAIGVGLRQWPSEWIARDVIDKVFELESVLYLPELRKQYVEEVLLNFSAWIGADISVQTHFVVLLRQTFPARMLRGFLGVQKLLDIVRLYYWDTNSTQGLELRPGARPGNSEVLRGMRLELLRTLDFLLIPSLLEEDSLTILNFLVSCNEASLVNEVLHFLLMALSSDNQTLFLRHISTASGLIDAFVTLAWSEAEGVRVAAMVLFSRLPVLDNSDFLVRVSPALLHALGVRPLTVQVLSISLSILVARSKTMHANVLLKMGPSDEVPSSVLSADPIIRNLAALDMLLGFTRAPVHVILTLLRSTLTLISLSEVNLEVFLMLPEWSVKLVRLYTMVECSDGGGGSEEVSSLVLSCKATLVEVFQRLLLRVIRKDARGVDVVRKTLCSIFLNGGGSLALSLGFAGSLLFGLCRILVIECRSVTTRKAPPAVLQEYDRKKGNVAFPNVCKLMLLVEEFIYYHTSVHDLENTIDECVRARGGWTTPRGDSSVSSSASESDQSPVMRKRGFSFSTPVASSRSVNAFFKMEGQANFLKNEALAAVCLEIMAVFNLQSDSTWKLLAAEAGSPSSGALSFGANSAFRAGGGRRLCVRLSLDVVRFSLNKNHLERALACLAEKKMQLTQFPEDALLVVRILKDRLSQRDEFAPLVMPVMQQLLRASLPMLASTAGKVLSLPPASHWDLLLSSDIAVVLEEWHSPRWETLVEYMEVKIANAQRDINLALWSPIHAALLVVLGEVADLMEQLASARQLAATECSDRRAECERRKAIPELARLETVKSGVLLQFEKSSRRAAHLLESLSRPRGPWALEETCSTGLHWKRDRFETESHLRPRFKLNLKFDLHQDKASSMFKRSAVVDINVEALKGIVMKKKGDGEEQSDAVLGDSDEVSTSAGAVVAPTQTAGLSPEVDDEGVTADDSSKALLEVFCSLIKPIKKIDGSLRLTTSRLIFSSSEKKKKTWLINDLIEMHFRRYLLRDSALEIKMVSHHGSILLNFSALKDRGRMCSKISDLRPARLNNRESSNPETVLRNSNLTELWQNNAISNMDYLMHLNSISGRTYNDLGQYPVFPWILQCYNESTVHLEDPKSYRDLSKPVGALNPDRLASFMDRYESFVDPEIPPFMYGSHYSNSGSVLFYLVRMEPYTTYHLALQGGRFDQADRMFHSVQRSWENVLSITSDVKELIPEWFYQPEMFVNSNKFELGYRQTGEALGDVVLPAWASSPEEFVRINRAALESDYVSANLHNWIDLIFGYKQRGEAAVAAKNVFFHLTYGGAVNWDAVQDQRERVAIEDQIRHFGQMPAQLMRAPHVARKPRVLRPGGLLGAGSSIGSGDPWVTGRSTRFSMHVLTLYQEEPVVFIGMMIRNTMTSPELLAAGPTSAVPTSLKRFVTVTASRSAAIHQWGESVAAAAPAGAALEKSSNANFSTDKLLGIEVDPSIATRGPIGVPLGAGVVATWRSFAVSPWAFVSVGHHDNTAAVCALDSNHNHPVQIQCLAGHKDLVTAVSMDGEYIVTGSRDLTMMLWAIVSGADGSVRFRVSETPRGVYYGHDAEVTCVCVTASLDLVVSGGRDGSVLVHELASRRLVRCLLPPSKSADASVGVVRTSTRGDIFVYTRLQRMYVLTQGGTCLAREDSDRVTCAAITRNGEFVATGSADCCITIRAMATLQIVHRLRTTSAILCISLTTDEHNILCGLENGKIAIVSGDSSGKRK